MVSDISPLWEEPFTLELDLMDLVPLESEFWPLVLDLGDEMPEPF